MNNILYLMCASGIISYLIHSVDYSTTYVRSVYSTIVHLLVQWWEVPAFASCKQRGLRSNCSSFRSLTNDLYASNVLEYKCLSTLSTIGCITFLQKIPSYMKASSKPLKWGHSSTCVLATCTYIMYCTTC